MSPAATAVLAVLCDREWRNQPLTASAAFMALRGAAPLLELASLGYAEAAIPGQWRVTRAGRDVMQRIFHGR